MPSPTTSQAQCKTPCNAISAHKPFVYNYIGYVLLLVALLLGVGLAWACGPYYQLVLDSRDDVLMSTPTYHVYDFLDELQLSSDKLQTLPDTVYDDTAIAKTGLSEAQFRQTLQMREAASSDEAYVLGEELPEDVRLYIAGAVDFHQYEQVRSNATAPQSINTFFSTQHHWNKALERFEAILALPPQQAQHRPVWATFMLGRMYAMEYGLLVDASVAKAQSGNNRQPASNPAPGGLQVVQSGMPHTGKSFDSLVAITAYSEQELRALSIKYFELTRTLVRQGQQDVLRLGEASLGDQARLYIWPCRWMALGKFPAPQCADTLSAEDFKQAFFYTWLRQP